jgi:hypothetical protein
MILSEVVAYGAERCKNGAKTVRRSSVCSRAAAPMMLLYDMEGEGHVKAMHT